MFYLFMFKYIYVCVCVINPQNYFIVHHNKKAYLFEKNTVSLLRSDSFHEQKINSRFIM